MSRAAKIKKIIALFLSTLLIGVIYSASKFRLAVSTEPMQLPDPVTSTAAPESVESDEFRVAENDDRHEPDTPSIESPEQTEKIFEFEEADLSLVDDSEVQELIKGLPLNRYRIVRINTDAMRAFIGDEQNNEYLNFRFFDDKVYQAKRDRYKTYDIGPKAGRAAWGGGVENDATTVVSIVVSPERVSIKTFGISGIYHTYKLSGSDYYVLVDLELENKITGHSHN